MKYFFGIALVLLAVGVALLGASLININQIKGGPTGNFVLTSVNGANSWSAPSASPNFSDAEIPTGVVNGINPTFTLLHTPIGSSLLLVRNGIVQQASGNDYTLTAGVITFVATGIPQTGDIIQAWYRF